MASNPTYVKPRFGDPGTPRLMDHLSNLYLDAGIVTPVVIPQLQNPANDPFSYWRLARGNRNPNTR